MKKSPGFRNCFKGIIIPSDWDSNGNIVGISLHAHDEKTYVIESSRIGNELYKYIHHNVKMNGKIRQRLDGRTLIRVVDYEVFTAPTEQVEKIV
jgi:hypothetical protein